MRINTIEWLKSAEMDLESIQLIMHVEKLTPVVSFHAQQAVEKCLKALLEEFAGKVPKEHSIIKLHKMVNEKVNLEIDYDIMTDFDQIYIEARYPGEAGLLPDGAPSIDEAASFYNFAMALFKRVKIIINQGI